MITHVRYTAMMLLLVNVGCWRSPVASEPVYSQLYTETGQLGVRENNVLKSVIDALRADFAKQSVLIYSETLSSDEISICGDEATRSFLLHRFDVDLNLFCDVLSKKKLIAHEIDDGLAYLGTEASDDGSSLTVAVSEPVFASNDLAFVYAAVNDKSSRAGGDAFFILIQESGRWSVRNSATLSIH